MKYTRLLSCLLYFTALKNIFADKYLSEELMGEVYKAQSEWYLNYPWDSRLIKGRHNGGLIYFGSGYKHCQHDLADH